jgi:ABC-2 type transport system permease protein
MTLLKLNLRALFSRMFMRSRNAKKRSPIILVLIALLVIYVVCVFFGMFGGIFYQLSGPLFSSGYGWLYFSFMGIAIFALCFVGSIFAAQNQIFTAKDNDLLLSLPVKPSSILVSRIASLLLLDYMFEIFVAIPAFVIWCISQPVTAVGVIFFIIAVLLLPLTALAFACFFAWLMALVTSRLRNKNIFTLVFSLLFLGLYFWFFSNIQNNMQLLLTNSTQIAQDLQRTLFPAYHLGVAIDSGSVISMLIFVLCAVAPFILAVLLLSVNFIKIATTNRGAAKIKYTEKTLKVSGIRTAFVVKELRHFISNPMYILNTSLGGVFMLAGAVLLGIKRDFVLSYIAQLAGAGINLEPATLVIIALSAVAALNFVSAPTISLEGKNLWIAKSIPVRSFDILLFRRLSAPCFCR